MKETQGKSDVNILELLLKISNDVSAIKTDINNLKDTQQKERADINKEIMDVRDDCFREIKSIESQIYTRVSALQTVQNTLVGDVDTLKHADEKKMANRWKTVTYFVLTALGGMLLAKIPDIVSYLVLISVTRGGN